MRDLMPDSLERRPKAFVKFCAGGFGGLSTLVLLPPRLKADLNF